MQSTVLIVNENVNARIIAETLLQSRGVPVVVAEDAMAALDVLERNDSVAVLLLDLDDMSPGMSGWELLRQVRRRYGGVALRRPPRIVAQSERKEAETEAFIRHLGADTYLRKPTEPAVLLDTVSSLLGQDDFVPRFSRAAR
jgi:hypothetical protein